MLPLNLLELFYAQLTIAKALWAKDWAVETHGVSMLFGMEG